MLGPLDGGNHNPHVHADVFRAIPISARLRVAFSLLLLLMAIGTGGFMLLSGMSFVDAFYQTVTTLSTVGFRELAPFGTTEKLFTSFLILFGVGTVLYTLTLVVQEALEGDLRSRFYRRRLELEIGRLSGHYVLCGFGRVGQEIARELYQDGQPFVVIEQRAAEALSRQVSAREDALAAAAATQQAQDLALATVSAESEQAMATAAARATKRGGDWSAR